MAYKFRKNTITGQPEVVINGFEKGIADSPYQGIADMRNVNIISVPDEASVNFATTALTIPPVVSAVAFTVTASNDTFTVASTSNFYNGMAITLNSLVGGTGLFTARVYWIGNLTSTTFKVYVNPSIQAGALVNVTVDGSGTYSSYTLSAPLDRVIDYQSTILASPHFEFILDSNGLVWWIYNQGGTITNTLVYIGNDTLTGTTDRAIQIWQGYIMVFRTSKIDYLLASTINTITDLDGGSGWGYDWKNVSSLGLTRRPTLVGQDDVLYYGNSNLPGTLGSILERAGTTFDPTSAATYTINIAALTLPSGDMVTALGELGVNLLIGGVRNYIYPWDRISTSFTYPLIIAENLTTRIVTTNSNAYIFAGNRGRIYITNGSNVELYKKVPDSITGMIDPYFNWQDTTYWKNQIYFSFTATNNAGTSIDTVAGVWAIDMTSNAFRYTNQLSYGTYTGTTSVILPNVLSDNPAGAGLYVGWTNGSTYGVDRTSSTPYTNYQTYIDCDLIPIGTFLNPATLQNIEWKLAQPLVSGEAVRLSFRGNLTDSFTPIGTTATIGLISDVYTANFQEVQWLQIRAELSSTASSPTYVRLREITFR